jgi:quinol monooxygenase YgiN
MTALQAIARHTIAQGNENRVYALLPHLMAAARSEPGNLAFDAYPKLNDQANHVLLERYTSPGIFARAPRYLALQGDRARQDLASAIQPRDRAV